MLDVVALLQGDVEKNLGWKPIPLFDRDNYAEVASMQVSFVLRQIQVAYMQVRSILRQIQVASMQVMCILRQIQVASMQVRSILW